MDLTLKGPGGGGGGWNLPPPLDVSRDNFAEIFSHAAGFHDFFLWSFAQLLALFSEKSGLRFESYATLCNRASAQNLKYSGFVYKTYGKWLLVPKLHFEL